MKKIYFYTRFICMIFIIFYFVSANSTLANWQNSNSGKSISSEQTISQTQGKEDSLPSGVTQDWLNSLQDGNGNRIITNNHNNSSRIITEDPEGDAMTERFFTGQAAEDAFGYSVSSAGDVNGDGYSDVIVGAYVNDAGGNNAGRAYIYFGGNIMDNTADVIFTGEAPNDVFGISVSTAGDVNGDGYSDVIVGAYLNAAGGNNAGRAYIYFGGNIMDNTADVIFTGEAPNDLFGNSVSTAGDVNGDGYNDVVVGSNWNDIGRAYIYFGGNAMDNISDVILTGVGAGNEFGGSVSTAGDVNGDGYNDVVVGAFLNDAGGSDAGRAYIFFGGNAMDNTADVILTGEAAGDRFGISVSTAGDVNGDGYSDVIVGAYLNDAGGTYSGRAYIYFGGNAMDNTADVIFTGEAAQDQFGYSVSTAGDVNGDGYSDVVVSSIINSARGTYSGRAYIYFGGTAMDITADVVLTGEAAGDYFGRSVSSAGDVNGDGYSDILIGANGNDAGGNNAGRAYIYKNSMTGMDIADEFFTGPEAFVQFGYSVSSAGDVNGDGYSDIIISVHGTSTGNAYIYYGGNTMDNTADVLLTGEANGDAFGFSVSAAGDVNSDGYSDIVVGALSNDTGGIDAGRAYIFRWKCHG
ncbi:MAG: FG-GAP repeat protein [Ignavibacteria bacterium]|nr:FG-GAP repeat protein [Ignavibacteria bacterium]